MTRIKVIDGTAYRLVKVSDKVGRPKKELSQVLLSTLILQRPQMTIKELSEYYKVSESTINRWMRKAREAYAKAEA